jgi:RNA polymerase subunit RPABC4/transcription elongation factor Spt4
MCVRFLSRLFKVCLACKSLPFTEMWLKTPVWDSLYILKTENLAKYRAFHRCGSTALTSDSAAHHQR